MIISRFLEVKLMLVLGLYLAALSVASEIKIPEPDPELVAYIEKLQSDPKFDLRRRLEELTGASNSIRHTDNPKDSHFDDTFHEFEEGEIVLSNVNLISNPVFHINKAVPDFLYGFSDVSVSFDSAIIQAAYELNQRYQNNPNETLSTSGNLMLTWNNIEAKGYFTFKPIDDSDGLISSNFVLDFNANDAEMSFLERSETLLDKKTMRAIGKQFGLQLQNDLFWKLENDLKENVDSFLMKQSLKKIFENNYQISNSYRAFSQERNVIANAIVDRMLNEIKNYIKEQGSSSLQIPTVRREFSRKFAFITFWGHLELNKGIVESVESLHRIGDGSFVIRVGVYHIAAGVQFDKLEASFAHYSAKIWNIGPSGRVTAKVGKNNLNFELVGKPNVNELFGFEIHDAKLKLHLSDFKITATGLTVLLNWLLNIIATAVVNCFHGTISESIVEEILEFLKTLSRTS